MDGLATSASWLEHLSVILQWDGLVSLQQLGHLIVYPKMHQCWGFSCVVCSDQDTLSLLGAVNRVLRLSYQVTTVAPCWTCYTIVHSC